MSQYLLLEKMTIQNANAIAGLTYGFPAITNFLGFAHALSRKLAQLPQPLGVKLKGVAVISHQNTVHARQPKGWGDYVFALTRNPLTQQGNTAPINEEGRMNLQVSLFIEIEGLLTGDLLTCEQLIEQVSLLLPQLRIAGGQLIDIKNISIPNQAEQAYVLRRLMPAFALVDRSESLAEHFQALLKNDPKASLLDAWCDFAQLKFAAEKPVAESLEHADEQNLKVEWKYQPKPKPGYLVPINCGYCAISPVYQAGEVANTRDQITPAVFAESAYSIGEWLSVYRAKSINQLVWRYEHNYPWYLAKTEPLAEENTELEFDEDQLLF